jgi:uncharacterized Zn finger protein
MSILQLSETIIQSYANPKSFQRGEAYYHEGAVLSLTQRGRLLQATVEGSEFQPYHVAIEFEGDEIASADCTCPYDFDGWCKHIVATLLTCLRQPARIEERPTLEQLLDRLNEVQTQRLLQELVAEQPELLDKIERLANRFSPSIIQSQPSQSPRQITIDTAPYRSQVRRILRDAVRYLEEGWEDDPVPEELYRLINEAQELVEQEDVHNAIAILEAITQACVENWDEVEEYGAENDEVARTLNEIWTEAILVAELTPPEKVDLQTNLESWQDEWNADFAMSLEALRQGWDYPPLQQVLKGEISQSGIWAGEAPDYAGNLALIRLKILNRQKRYQEYLYLAEAEGQIEQFLIMLARLERIDAAMEAADKQLTSMEQALALAEVLLGQGAVEEALQIAQRGFLLPGNCEYKLATWTSELAEQLEKEDIAIAARIKAFRATPSFPDYRKIETLAGEDWEILKEDLLDYLRSYSGWGLRIDEAKVNIFLHEELVDDAINVVSNLSSYQSDLIHQVMEAAISHRPDWVIENAQRRAESIMDAKKAEYYHHAVEWLRKARKAYYEAGRQAEWSAYRAKLMQIHLRKYKLMGMLKQTDLE